MAPVSASTCLYLSFPQSVRAVLQDWPDAPAKFHASQDANAILIFMPGAPEITRLVRQLESSPQLRQAARGQIRVLPLHGALPSHAQVQTACIVPPWQVFCFPYPKTKTKTETGISLKKG